jgi:AraC family transcriptional regulator
MNSWDKISSALGEPMLSVEIGGTPLRAERYIFQLGSCEVPPLDSLVLACHLGGARATAGRSAGRSFDFLAGSSTVFQPGFASRWTFCGAMDVAMFHVLDPDNALVRHLQRLLTARTRAPLFADPLVNASAGQLLGELARATSAGPADGGFVERLAHVMIEQTCRVLEGRTGRHVPPDALQLGRLQEVLKWIGDNLSNELSNAELAERAGVSESHFRRIFQEAMGMTPHRYVLRLRLERVHELLTRTSFSIARVAAQCGFNSQSHMTSCFAQAYGITPARARQQSRM